MKNDINIIEYNDIDKLYNYLLNIREFEEITKQIEVYYIPQVYYYLINLSDYNYLKEQIKYDFLFHKITNEKVCKEEIKKYISNSEIIIQKIEQIKIIDITKLDIEKTYSEQFKIINEKLADIICYWESNDEYNKFQFSLDYPKFHLKEKNLDFLYNDYIIEKRLLLTPDNSKILYTSKVIIEYYKLYNHFRLKEKNSKKEKYYLIPSENIKNILYFILKHDKFNFEDENILYEIIEYVTENKDKTEIKNLLKLDILNFKSKDEFKKYNKKKDISIINEYLYFLIKENTQNNSNKDLSYYCYSELDGVIHIEFNEKEEVKYIPNDNILQYQHRIKGKSFLRRIFSSVTKNIFEGIKYLVGFIYNYDKNENNLINEEESEINNYNSKEIKSGDIDFISVEKNDNDQKIKENDEFINIVNEDDFEEIKLKKKKEIKTYFEQCPGIGLENIGATCYMNATLQCFEHIEKLINYFKYSSHINNSPNITKIVKAEQNNMNLLYPSFKLLIEKLWPNDYLTITKKYYAPNDFKNKISEMNPLFQGVAANDSKDLVNFIIMTLHEELNKAKDNNNIINEAPIIDQTNKKLVLNNFLEEFAKKNRSIISDLFYALNYSITECTNCHMKLYNYQIYFFIIFPLEEVRKFKLNNQFNFNNMNYNFNNNNFFMNNFNNFNNFNDNNNFLLNNKTVNIYDCFDFDKKINLMSGDNAMYCNGCKKTCDCTMQTLLAAGPEILILLLNRGKGKEFDVKIDFYEEINLYNYIEYKETGYKYKLIGVISHIGESGMGGHFIAYCKDPIKSKWNKFNDAIVTEVVDFQNEVINFAMPYLLFYQKYND